MSSEYPSPFTPAVSPVNAQLSCSPVGQSVPVHPIPVHVAVADSMLTLHASNAFAPPFLTITVDVPSALTMKSSHDNPGTIVHDFGNSLCGFSTPKYAKAPIAISTIRIAHPYVIKNSNAACP